MRQLKTFMRNRKKEMLACGPCECRTLQCWRYANENCGCGESNLPNYVRVEEDEIGVYWAHFFNDSGRDNTISIETDYEAGGIKTVVGEFPIIKDEDTRGLWYQVWDNIDAEVVEKLFGMDEGKEGVGQFTPEAMAQFNALINNPTEEQAQILREWLEDKASDEYDPPHYPIVIFDNPDVPTEPSIIINSTPIPEGWAIEDGEGPVLSWPYQLIIENETVDAYTSEEGAVLWIEDGDKTYNFQSTDEEDAPAYTHAWTYNGNALPDIDDDSPLSLNAGAEILCTWTSGEEESGE